jgi:hypothetical protein
VLAKQGETVGAKKLLAQSREFLVATGEEELLEECNKLTST